MSHGPHFAQAPLAEPQSREELSSEVERLRVLGRFRGLSVLLFHGEEAPKLLLEIGRIREAVFRAAGAGRGETVDLDALDHGSTGYEQLCAWDPARAEVVAVIRLQRGARAQQFGTSILRTASLFEYTKEFRDHVLPFALELGRSVVNPRAARSRLGLYAIWQGLSAICRESSDDVRFFFGNVTVYRDFSREALGDLISLTRRLYPPPVELLRAREGLSVVTAESTFECAGDVGKFHCLRAALANRGERVPTMLQSYLSLGDDVWCGPAAIDADFAGAVELAIVVPLRLLSAEARARFQLPDRDTYQPIPWGGDGEFNTALS